MSEIESSLWRVRQTVRATTFLHLDKIVSGGDTVTSAIIASETFQHTGSFKFRAAYCAALNSSGSHLLTASSGNFGAALAYSCHLLQKKCTVVMPETSATVKIAAVRGHGARVALVDTNTISRAEKVAQLAAEIETEEGRGAIDILSAYDDLRVIAGNSTLGEELAEYLEANPQKFDCVIAPIGGGGLTAGIIEGLRRKKSNIEVYAAEPALGDDAYLSMQAGKIVSNVREPLTIADGARTISLGKNNFAILQKELKAVFTATEEEIERAVRLLYSGHLKCEPTAALPLAVVLKEQERFAGRKPLLVVSGANVDSATYARIISG